MDGSFSPEIIDRLTPDELRKRGSLKWQQCPPGGIGAQVAEMDFGAAPAVLDALRIQVDNTNFGYLPPDLDEALCAACAEWQQHKFGWAVEPEQVTTLPDVLRGLELAISLFTTPGSPIVVPTPAYMPFLLLPGYLGRDVIQVPMTNQDGYYEHDLDGIDAALASGAELVVWCNPHNPTGRVFSSREITELSAVVARHGARVFSDEIWAPLTFGDARHVPYASVSDATRRQGITCVAASKAFNLAGLKAASLILTEPDDRAKLAEAGFFATHGASTPGVAASAAAYRDDSDWLSGVLDYLDGNRRRMAELVSDLLPKTTYRIPDGTYIPA